MVRFEKVAFFWRVIPSEIFLEVKLDLRFDLKFVFDIVLGGLIVGRMGGEARCPEFFIFLLNAV